MEETIKIKLDECRSNMKGFDEKLSELRRSL